jgi:uncharacterized protein
MMIAVANLKEGVSERVSGVLEPEALDLDCVDLHYKSNITVDGVVEKVLNTLSFHGTIERTIEHVCARCLKTAEEGIREPVDLAYEINGLVEINMTDDIRDALLLSHPSRFLCSANCKGLCAVCGKDLNMETCRCENRAEPHAFDTLKNYLKKTNRN